MLITDCVFDGRIRTFGLEEHGLIKLLTEDSKNLEGRVRAYRYYLLAIL